MPNIFERFQNWIKRVRNSSRKTSVGNGSLPRGSKSDVKPPTPIESKHQGPRDESRVQTEVQRTPEPERKILPKPNEDTDYGHLVNEDHVFNAGEKTPVYEHSNPVIRRILDAIASEKNLEVLYVIDIDRLLTPNDQREYEFRKIKPVEVFSSSAWTKSLYIGAEANGEIKTFRADRMALLNSDGTISIGGDVPCSSKGCSNEARVELDKYNQSKADKFCASCQPNLEPAPQIGPDEDNDNGDAAQKKSESGNEHAHGKGPRNILDRKDRKVKNPKPIQQRDAHTEPWHRRPKLICQKPLGEPYYEIELNIKDCNVAEVRQNGMSLPIESGRCLLLDYSGYLEVTYEDGTRDKVTLFDDDNPLIFKSNGGWEGTGRNLKRITVGYFWIFAPCDWKRNGNPPQAYLSCQDENFLVHHFVREEDQGDFYAFCGRQPLPTGDPIKLIGEPIYDDSDKGQLFVDDTPILENNANFIWGRVGERRPGIWGEKFKPKDTTLGEVLDGRQGHFFIRVFDIHNENANWLDSTVFRYMRDLRKIIVDGRLYTQDTILPPPAGGYSLAKLQFSGVDGAHPDVEVKDERYATEQSKGIVLVEPHPDADKLICSLSFGENRVEVTINLPRIWWRLENGNKHDDWCSTPYQVTREKFLEYARDGTIIKLRLPSRTNSKIVYIGFDNALKRTDRPVKSQEYDNAELELNLRHFKIDEQIRNPLSTDTSLNIQYGEFTISIVQVQADLDLSPGAKSSSDHKPRNQLRPHIPPSLSPLKSPKGTSNPRTRERPHISLYPDPQKIRTNNRNFKEKPNILRKGNRNFKRSEVQRMSLADIHHLNLSLLRRCINERGKIYPAYRNGLPAKYQRAVRVAVIRARYLALLPYVPAHRKITATLYDGGKSEILGS